VDERRIDAIARFLDAIQTRRGTLRSALAGVVSLAVLADPLASEAVNKKRRKRRRRKKRRRNRCGGGRTRCGGACVDLKTDPRHCGRCLNDCDDDEVCSNGECGDGCGGVLTLCNGVCVDTNTSDANCGRCGRACDADQTCVAGDCEQECPAGQTLCDDECVDTDIDPENCGACGRECESGAVCFNGVRGCTVCDDDDEGQFTSVQAAIDAASPGDVITICSGQFTGNITISKNVSLVGSLEDTELLGTGNGSVTVGAGIFNSGGTVELASSTVFENDASDTGGGIFNTQGGLVTLDNQSAVVDNDPNNCVGTNACGA
jgi:hypothetical protein